ncbi:MAG: CaiB/BaiF CoA-transferase family protein [Gammaproteobacteria bacterium]|nr:CaiB/BaiF CoA-transferase family protein [Gammaproteobacteria bacterium]
MTSSDRPEAADHPLEHLKVLDLSRVLAGPFAGRMLCDLGADVVKVEPPEGDITRLWGRVIAGVPGYFHQQNAGKRNISLDLRVPGATDLVFELVRAVDILIENFRPDVMARLGLGYDTLREVNPRLIMLSISGFGHDGPESHLPAYAPVIHAEAGLIDRLARRGKIPPKDMPLSVADTNASLHGLVALLSAVIMRERTGFGQHIDIAMLDATIASDDQLHYDLEDSHDTGPIPNDIWETQVGPMLVSADFRHFWRMLTTKSMVEDPTNKDTDLPTKIALRREVVTRFMQAFTSWEQIEESMAKLNIAWGRVRSAATLTDQPTIKSRRAIVEIDDRAGHTRPITQSPYRFSNAKSGVKGPAAHRGEHNRVVLRDWLDKSDSDIDALAASGVLQIDPETLG